jgi:murein DD-endopeptidase MepM/ murein hydrolase activator NlpD
MLVVVDRRRSPVFVNRRPHPPAARARGLPHVYRGGSRANRDTMFEPDRGSSHAAGGRFRWLLSTCLAAGVGAVAILVVVYGSSDRSEQGGLVPALKRLRDGKPELAVVSRKDDGLKWAVPKSDKLQTGTGAAATRFIIHDSMKVKKANREYIHAKPYARIVVRLAPVSPDYADVVPPFNPFKLYAGDQATTTARPSASGDGQVGSDVAIKVVELLGGLLPGEDGQELDTQDVTDLVARSRDVATASALEAPDAPAQSVPSSVAKDDAARRRLALDAAPLNTTLHAKTRVDADDQAADDIERQQVRVVKVGKADTLVKILMQAGADSWQAKAMSEAAKSVFPDGALATGQEVRITMVPSLTLANRSEPARFSVFSDGHEHKVTVSRTAAGEFVASATPFDDQAIVQAGAAEPDQPQSSSLYSSFYAAGLMQNVPPDTIMQMLRVHAFETDFRRRVRAGDVIEMFFDLRDDTSPDSPPGELLFTGITTAAGGGRFYRFRTADGLIDFYDDQGNNSKRFLMRKPIRSDDVRLTSGFGMRLHPLFNDRRLHSGIDWSGTVGTPIVASGNGVVEEALYKGGNGKYVRLRHANGYQTTYSHMSGFARGVELGTKVRQGQIIGFLGNTGYSTGPHLHFEVLVNNRFVDPLSIQVPRERQLTGKPLADFQKERARIDDLMRRPPVMTQSK